MREGHRQLEPVGWRGMVFPGGIGNGPRRVPAGLPKWQRHGPRVPGPLCHCLRLQLLPSGSVFLRLHRAPKRSPPADGSLRRRPVLSNPALGSTTTMPRGRMPPIASSQIPGRATLRNSATTTARSSSKRQSRKGEQLRMAV